MFKQALFSLFVKNKTMFLENILQWWIEIQQLQVSDIPFLHLQFAASMYKGYVIEWIMQLIIWWPGS